MEDEELVKALKFAIEQKELDWAGYWNEKYQWIEFSMKDVFDVIQRLQSDNESLKKQVDELKQENSVLSVTVELQDKAIEQAVKDTAKEILQKIMNIIKKSNGFLPEETVSVMAKINGVEVE